MASINYDFKSNICFYKELKNTNRKISQSIYVDSSLQLVVKV